jgi:predicted DNA-binding transcriptional regulator YafY
LSRDSHLDCRCTLLDDLERNGLSHWARKVRAIPNGKALIPAPLSEATWQTVSEALLSKRAIDVTYLSRSAEEKKQFTLHPQGLVSRHSVTYLLATVKDYTDVRQFALHRIEEARLSEADWHDAGDFDLDDYIAGGAFGYLQGKAPLTLVANVAPQVAWLLSETPLGEEQRLKALPDSDWQRLEAEVPDDQQTLWWLMGMGANVEVLEPETWRREIYTSAKAIMERGSCPRGHGATRASAPRR